jgi:outer membrane protein assembly factor BamB
VRLVLVVPALVAAAWLAGSATAGDWLQFGIGPSRSNASPAATGITAANVDGLVRQQVRLPGIADNNAVYLANATIGGASHDAFFVTTSYGRTLAIDANTGSILWQYLPPGISSWEHTPQITTSAPAVDPGRRFLYSASPDGKIHKLAIADGSEVTAGSWPVTITLDPKHEKIGPGINVSGNLVLASTGGYIGDIPPYVGHAVAIDRATGRLLHAFNALCSNRHGLIQPSSCQDFGAAMWGRGGIVVEPGSHKLLVATGNGPWNGRTDWGDSLLELSPDASTLLQAYTPRHPEYLEGSDLDLGSASPAILTKNLIVQPGKDGKLRLLDLRHLNGRTARAAPITGGELQILPGPKSHLILTAPCVWRNGTQTWVFVGNFAAIAGYLLLPGTKPKLKRMWQVTNGSSSPVLAGGLLYSYDPLQSGFNVYRPTTGKLVTTLPTGKGHWNSPIVADGRVAVPEGDSNDHDDTGVLDIFRLPGS